MIYNDFVAPSWTRPDLALADSLLRAKANMKEPDKPSQISSSAGFMSSFLTQNRPPQHSIDHFRTTWLNKYLSTEAYVPIATFSRHLKATGEDYFFSRTINTPDTIPHMVSLHLKDFRTPAPVASIEALQGDLNIPSHRRITAVPESPDALILIQLGCPGIDGHPNTLHGGLICAILDETMGLLVMLHDNNIRHTGDRNALYTANLNVSYRGPVPTPSQILVRTWLVGRSGRKWFSKGQICNENGQVLAEAEGLWVSVKEKL